jgi:hypothetical protein
MLNPNQKSIPPPREHFSGAQDVVTLKRDHRSDQREKQGCDPAFNLCPSFHF